MLISILKAIVVIINILFVAITFFSSYSFNDDTVPKWVENLSKTIYMSIPLISLLLTVYLLYFA